MNKYKYYIGIVFIVLLIIGNLVEVSEQAPDNTIVYANTVLKNYYGEPTRKNELKIKNDNISLGKGPTLLDQAEERGVEKMTLSSARASGYEPRLDSVNNGDFIGETHSLIYVFFQRMGILQKSPRWNPDGTWNY